MGVELMTINGGWLALKNAVDSLPVPFTNDIVLAEIEVEGTNHIESVSYKTENLSVGIELKAFREPDNRLDPTAIRLETQDGVKLGYVPRRMNQIPARLMDAGKLLIFKVTERKVIDYYVRIRGELIMREF